jgi:hypothetical protein
MTPLNITPLIQIWHLKVLHLSFRVTQEKGVTCKIHIDHTSQQTKMALFGRLFFFAYKPAVADLL